MPAPMGHAPYPGCEKGGRPKEYTTEFIEKAADDLLEYFKDPSSVFMEKFLLSKGVTRVRYNEWKETNHKFRYAYDIAKELQEQRLKEGSLFKNYDTSMGKFLLINNHGYAEKTETKVSGDANNPLAFIMDNIQSSKELVNGDKG